MPCGLPKKKGNLRLSPGNRPTNTLRLLRPSCAAQPRKRPRPAAFCKGNYTPGSWARQTPCVRLSALNLAAVAGFGDEPLGKGEGVGLSNLWRAATVDRGRSRVLFLDSSGRYVRVGRRPGASRRPVGTGPGWSRFWNLPPAGEASILKSHDVVRRRSRQPVRKNARLSPRSTGAAFQRFDPPTPGAVDAELPDVKGGPPHRF